VDQCQRLEPVADYGLGTMLFRIRPEPIPGSNPACRLASRLYDEARAIQQEEQRNIDLFELYTRSGE
jgi:hypothetical protein